MSLLTGQGSNYFKKESFEMRNKRITLLRMRTIAQCLQRLVRNRNLGAWARPVIALNMSGKRFPEFEFAVMNCFCKICSFYVGNCNVILVFHCFLLILFSRHCDLICIWQGGMVLEKYMQLHLVLKHITIVLMVATTASIVMMNQ